MVNINLLEREHTYNIDYKFLFKNRFYKYSLKKGCVVWHSEPFQTKFFYLKSVGDIL